MTSMAHKSSRGRNTRTAARAVHVETLDCPSGGLNVLTNDENACTYCSGCGATWGQLDAEVRR